MELPLTNSKLWCVCLKPAEQSRFMIMCDKCSNWYHGNCMGLTKKRADALPQWICPGCTQLERVVLKPFQDALLNVQDTINNSPKVVEFQEQILKLQSKNSALAKKAQDLEEIHSDKIIEFNETILKLQSKNSVLENKITELKAIENEKGPKLVKFQEQILKLQSKNSVLEKKVQDLEGSQNDKIIELNDTILKLQSKNSVLENKIKELTKIENQKSIELQETIVKPQCSNAALTNNSVTQFGKKKLKVNGRKKCLSLTKHKSASQPLTILRDDSSSLSDDDFQPKKNKKKSQE